MKNYEKYRDLLVNPSFNNKICDNFIKPKILKPMGKECLETACNHCHVLTMLWLMDEYKEPEEPEIDWNKVPVDTKIYVKNEGCKTWFKRYFAKYENGKIYAWDYGYTSWTVGGENNFTSWDYSKLAEPEEEV